MPTSDPSSQPVLCVSKTSLPLNPAQDFSSLCPSPAVHGPILPWPLSLVSPSSIVFLKLLISLPCPNFPSARETADLLVDHVFHFHGIPSDIVSDRGPQFTSQSFKTFSTALGAAISLSSGYHPKPIAKLNKPIRRWRLLIRPPGAPNCPGWNMLTTQSTTQINASSGMSTFLCSLGYQSPLFHVQEQEIAVPSGPLCSALLCSALLCAATRTEKQANCCRIPAPNYMPGQSMRALHYWQQVGDFWRMALNLFERRGILTLMVPMEDMLLLLSLQGLKAC
ncbi:uncharacterized protein LOC122866677 [Siniperca chuatsi]|uniref:uncharacterized protein LOC122866677 n=1 Tax=Siniperca chuatsi TaxID=119488 RepID=UPI001CE043B3|nr:uncharacterized protein LOC122866677 [Siniperca chuatsi]